MKNRQDRFRGLLLDTAVGDSLGLPAEGAENFSPADGTIAFSSAGGWSVMIPTIAFLWPRVFWPIRIRRN